MVECLLDGVESEKSCAERFCVLSRFCVNCAGRVRACADARPNDYIARKNGSGPAEHMQLYGEHTTLNTNIDMNGRVDGTKVKTKQKSSQVNKNSGTSAQTKYLYRLDRE